jgi:hypothetical protein
MSSTPAPIGSVHLVLKGGVPRQPGLSYPLREIEWSLISVPSSQADAPSSKPVSTRPRSRALSTSHLRPSSTSGSMSGLTSRVSSALHPPGRRRSRPRRKEQRRRRPSNLSALMVSQRLRAANSSRSKQPLPPRGRLLSRIRSSRPRRS